MGKKSTPSHEISGEQRKWELLTGTNLGCQLWLQRRASTKLCLLWKRNNFPGCDEAPIREKENRHLPRLAFLRHLPPKTLPLISFLLDAFPGSHLTNDYMNGKLVRRRSRPNLEICFQAILVHNHFLLAQTGTDKGEFWNAQFSSNLSRRRPHSQGNLAHRPRVRIPCTQVLPRRTKRWPKLFYVNFMIESRNEAIFCFHESRPVPSNYLVPKWRPHCQFAAGVRGGAARAWDCKRVGENPGIADNQSKLRCQSGSLLAWPSRSGNRAKPL